MMMYFQATAVRAVVGAGIEPGLAAFTLFKLDGASQQKDEDATSSKRIQMFQHGWRTCNGTPLLVLCLPNGRKQDTTDDNGATQQFAGQWHLPEDQIGGNSTEQRFRLADDTDIGCREVA